RFFQAAAALGPLKTAREINSGLKEPPDAATLHITDELRRSRVSKLRLPGEVEGCRDGRLGMRGVDSWYCRIGRKEVDSFVIDTRTPPLTKKIPKQPERSPERRSRV